MFKRILCYLTKRVLKDDAHSEQTQSLLVVGGILIGTTALIGVLLPVIRQISALALPSPLLPFWQGPALLGLFLIIGLALLLARLGHAAIGSHILLLSMFVVTTTLAVWLGIPSNIFFHYLTVVASAVVLFDLRVGVVYALTSAIAFLIVTVGEMLTIWPLRPYYYADRPLTALWVPLEAILSTTLLILYCAWRMAHVAKELDYARSEILTQVQQRQLDRERLQAMQRLLAIGRVLSSTLDLAEVLALIMDKLEEMLPHDSAAILLLTPGRDALVMHATHGYDETRRALSLTRRLPLSRFATFHDLVENAWPVVVDDAWADPRWVELETALRVRSWLGVPLLVRDEVIGALSIDRFRRHAFSADDITTAQAFATQAAIAIQNANLYRSVEQQAQALEQAHHQLLNLERQRTEYYSMIIHDLRSPLTVAFGYVELLLDPDEGNVLTEDQLFMVENVRVSINRVLTLVNDFLDYSKIEAGFLGLHRSEVDLRHLIDRVVEALRGMAADNGLEITWNSPERCSPVWGDPTRLTQVIDNLIVNAIKYTPIGGHVEVCLTPRANHLLVEVKDTGLGVPPEMQPVLFDAYRQIVNGSLKRPIRGTGLGLFIVRRIVEAHGGTVGVQSTGLPGEGSCFYFTIPLTATNN